MRFRWWLAVLIILVVIIGSGVVLRQQLGRWVLGRTLQAFGRTVHGRIEWDRMAGDMFSNPKLFGVTVVTNGDSLKADTLSVRYDLLALVRGQLAGRLVLSEVKVVRPRGYLRMHRPSPPPSEGERTFPNLVIKNLSIETGSLYWNGMPRLDSVGLRLMLASRRREMRLEVIDAAGRFTQDSRKVWVRHLQGAAVLTPDSLVVSRLDVLTTRSRLSASVKLAIQPRGLALQIENLTIDLPELVHQSGRLFLKGAVQYAKGKPEAQVRYSAEGLCWREVSFPKLTGTITVQESVAQAVITGSDAALGSFTCTADLGLKRFDFSGTAEVSRLAVQRFESSLPEFRLDARLSVAGVLGSLRPGTDSATRARGWADTAEVRMAGRISELGIDTMVAAARYEGGEIELRELEMFGAAGGLRFHGAARKGLVRADCSLDSLDLDIIGRLVGFRLAGRATGKLWLLSHRDTWELTGFVRMFGLNVAGVEVTEAVAEVELLAQGPGRLPFLGRQVAGRLAVGGEGIEFRSLEFTAAQFVWTGPGFDFRIDRSGERLVAWGEVEVRQHGIEARVDTLEVVSGTDTVVTAQPFLVSWQSDSVMVNDVSANVADGTVGLALLFRKGRAPWVALSGRNLNLRKVQRLVHWSAIESSLGEVWGTLSFDVQGGETLQVQMTGADIELTAIKLTWKRLDAVLALTRSDSGSAGPRAQVRIDRFAFVHHVDTSNLTGTVHWTLVPRFHFTGLNLRGVFADPGTWVLAVTKPYVDFREGPVFGNFVISGDPKEPNIAGRARVANGLIYVPSVNTNIDRVNAELTFKDNRIILEKLSGRCGKGIVTATGFWELGQFYHSESMRYWIRFDGAAANPVAWAYGIGSGEIAVSWQKGQPVLVAGVVDVQEALLTPGFGGAGTPPSVEPSPVAFDLRIRGNRGIWLRNRDADIELAGDLAFRRTGEQTVYSGELTARQGNFYYLDHSLKVVQAKLTFANVPQFNPDIDLTAELVVRERQRAGNTPDKVVMAVTGTLEKPVFVLSTEPPLWDEAQILSYLSLNVTLDELTAMEQKEAVTRLLSDRLLGYFQTQMSKKVRGLVALDYLEFESGLTNGQGAKVTVGKYVGQNLYVSYSQNFTGELQPAFRVEYYLNRRNELLAERSTDGRYSLRFRFKLRY